MDSRSRTIARGVRTAGHGLAFASLLSGVAAGETRTGTTSLSITVERHSAIVIPADACAAVLLSDRVDAAEGPAAAGNGNPTLITIDDSRSFAAASSRRARVAVTVFEP